MFSSGKQMSAYREINGKIYTHTTSGTKVLYQIGWEEIWLSIFLIYLISFERTNEKQLEDIVREFEAFMID